MNVDRVKLWIEALRTGEFQQGQNNLYKDGKYCCLGVACVVALREGAIERLPWETPFAQAGYSNGYWPRPVMEWFGFTEGPNLNMDDSKPDFWVTAVGANDDLGWSFDQIADALESRIQQQNGDNA